MLALLPPASSFGTGTRPARSSWGTASPTHTAGEVGGASSMAAALGGGDASTLLGDMATEDGGDATARGLLSSGSSLTPAVPALGRSSSRPVPPFLAATPLPPPRGPL
eukprot:scaffold54537_cov27-Tisochrysis_lutea.AAC.1